MRNQNFRTADDLMDQHTEAEDALSRLLDRIKDLLHNAADILIGSDGPIPGYEVDDILAEVALDDDALAEDIKKVEAALDWMHEAASMQKYLYKAYDRFTQLDETMVELDNMTSETPEAADYLNQTEGRGNW